jgi:hypothetical protein
MTAGHFHLRHRGRAMVTFDPGDATGEQLLCAER